MTFTIISGVCSILSLFLSVFALYKVNNINKNSQIVNSKEINGSSIIQAGGDIKAGSYIKAGGDN